MVPRHELVRACLGFDMLGAAREVGGDTLAIDEQTYAEADWVCRQQAEL
jgi:hypothetical protein